MLRAENDEMETAELRFQEAGTGCRKRVNKVQRKRSNNTYATVVIYRQQRLVLLEIIHENRIRVLLCEIELNDKKQNMEV
jgi:hypothetical protein